MESRTLHSRNETHKNNSNEIHLPPFRSKDEASTAPNDSQSTHGIENSHPIGEPDSLDDLFYELDDTSNDQPEIPSITTKPATKNEDGLDDEISKALLSFNKFNRNEQLDLILNSNPQDSALPPSSSSSSDNGSPFDSPDTLTSIATNEEEFKSTKAQSAPSVNQSTVASIKEAMINTSKLTSLFTTLKVTYLKLCKEFNYLLSKFNENEKVKIELIHENNELKRLLAEMIREREKEKRQFEQDLTLEKNKHKMCHLNLQVKSEPVDNDVVEDSRTQRRKRRAVELSK